MTAGPVGTWDQLFADLKSIKESPWSYAVLKLFDKGTENRLRTKHQSAANLRLKILALGAKVTALADADAAAANLPQNLAGQSWAAATAQGGRALEDIGPIREAFMAQNILQLGLPGLVQIGASHVEHLRAAAAISKAKYHDSYDAFVADLAT